MFESLTEGQRKCFISFDEMNIKPGLHYQGKYVLDNAMNTESDCPATKMIALMVNPSVGVPAFLARMIPVHNLTAEFLYDKVGAGGYVFTLISENLKGKPKR